MKLIAPILLFFTTTLIAQPEAARMLMNAGFEEPDNDKARPFGWMNCYDLYGAPIDLHHASHNSYRTKTKAYNGLGFAGLGLYEEGQRTLSFQLLDRPLTPGVTYSIGVRARVPKQYPDNFMVNVGRKSKIRAAGIGLFLGTDFCNTPEVVVVSPPVITRDWQHYQLEFTAPADGSNFLGIGLVPDPGHPEPYNAYVIIDEITPITYVRGAGEAATATDMEYVKAVNYGAEIQPNVSEVLYEFGDRMIFDEDGSTMSETSLRVLRNILKQTIYKQGAIELVIRQPDTDGEWSPGQRERWLKKWIDDRFPQTENIQLRVASGRENPTRYQYANRDFYVRVETSR